MEILPGLKTCRKGLHQYSTDLKECPECSRWRSRLWRERNPERNKEYSRHWGEQNPERVKELNRSWREQNPEQHKENSRRWREQNPERVKENSRRWYEQNTERKKEYNRRRYEQNPGRNRELNRRWHEQNSDKWNASQAKRRAAKKQSIAPWSDLDAIKQIYAEATELTKSTGIRHEVDHIYPLQSEYMCGLHVETNLQILTKSENVAKSNRTWPGQLDCQRSPISKVFTPEQIALAQERKAHS